MGGPDASLSGHGCKMPVNLGGRPMSWSLFYLCLKLRICLQSWFFLVGCGMFCLFRAALLSASPGGVLAWDGLK